MKPVFRGKVVGFTGKDGNDYLFAVAAEFDALSELKSTEAYEFNGVALVAWWVISLQSAMDLQLPSLRDAMAAVARGEKKVAFAGSVTRIMSVAQGVSEGQAQENGKKEV